MRTPRRSLATLATCSIIAALTGSAADAAVSSSSRWPRSATSAHVTDPESVGRLLWAQRFQGAAHRSDLMTGTALSPDGSTIFVTGTSHQEATLDSDFVTIAYDAATGEDRWIVHYSGPGANQDAAGQSVLSSDGSTLFVTGSSHVTESDSDYTTIAYDAETGAQKWVALHDSPGVLADNDLAYLIALSPDDGTVYVSGSVPAGGGRYGYTTVAYDTATGTERWVAPYRQPGKDLFPFGLAASPDGSRVFVSGTARIAYDAFTGAVEWALPTDGGEYMALSPDGSMIFEDGRVGSPTNYLTLAYSAATGAQVWSAHFDSPWHGFDTPAGLVASADGSTVFVTGSSQDRNAMYDFLTVAYDTETGTTRWVARGDGPQHRNDNGDSVALSPDGTRLFVVGRSDWLGLGTRSTTLVYDVATGAPLRVVGLRVDRYLSSPRLNVSADGSTMFIGGSTCCDQKSDLVTLAYDIS